MKKEEYIMFVDETNKTNSSNYFCLAGVVIKRSDYSDKIVPQINRLKTSYLGTTDDVLHYTDIKKGKCSKLKDAVIRNKFFMDLKKIIGDNDITILATYFNKIHMSQIFNKCNISDYNVAFRNLIENYVHFLTKNNGHGMIVMESRSLNENSFLQKTFYQYIQNGSEYFNSSTISGALKCLGFTIKEDNCAGLQLADFMPITLVRMIENKKDHYSLQKVIKTKIYNTETEHVKIVGLKDILGSADDSEKSKNPNDSDSNNKQNKSKK